MTESVATEVVPVYGMVWRHAKREAEEYRDGGYVKVPLELKVTKVDKRTGKVYSKHLNGWGRDQRVKTPLASFGNFVAEVVSVPQAGANQSGPKFSDAQAAALFAKADAAGQAAAEAKVPVPMHVVQRANPFDDNSPVVRDFGLEYGGVCGFAWVKVRPANGSFGRWLKKTGKVHGAAYTGGYDVWVRGYGQSMEKKEAYATAFAEVLEEAGVTAYAQSRMD